MDADGADQEVIIAVCNGDTEQALHYLAGPVQADTLHDTLMLADGDEFTLLTLALSLELGCSKAQGLRSAEDCQEN